MLVAVTIDFVSKFEHKREFQNRKAIIQLIIITLPCSVKPLSLSLLHCIAHFSLEKKFVLFHFPSRTVCSTLISEFAIKKLLAARLVRRATCDLKTLARRIIPLAPGYRTALLSCPEVCSDEKIWKCLPNQIVCFSLS